MAHYFWPFLLLAAIFLAISCGASATPTPVGTPTPVATSTPRPTPTITPTPAPTRTPTPAPTPVTAQTLYAAYDTNEIGANLKYGNSRIPISGTVRSIADAGDYWDVKLRGSAIGDVVCKLAQTGSNERKIAELSPGDSIVIKGYPKEIGFTDMEVTDCEIQRPTTSRPTTSRPTNTIPAPEAPPIEISASALYSEYQTNEVGAKVKYEGKWALISGTVALIEEAGDYNDVKLFGGQLGAATASAQFVSETIVCKVDPKNVEAIVDLKRGDRITIRGIIEGMSFVDIEVTDCTIEN